MAAEVTDANFENINDSEFLLVGDEAGTGNWLVAAFAVGGLIGTLMLRLCDPRFMDGRDPKRLR